MLKLLAAAAILAPSLELVESRRLEKTKVDRAIGVGKHRVIPKRPSLLDNSNSSYGWLNMRALPAWCPEGVPAWAGPVAWRLDGLIQSLKDACRKGILAASDKS